MKKFWIQFVTLVIIILGSLYVTYNQTFVDELIANQGLGPAKVQAAKQLKVGDTTINVEIAETAEDRSKGLGGKENLASGSGMLFVFPETGSSGKKYQFWMKGLKFPLDFIWINNGRVVDILKNIPAPLPGQADQSLPIYEPIVPVNQVLEVNAGFVDAHNIKVGDAVELLP